MAIVDEAVEIWRQIIIGDHKSWVLSAHGTCVVLAGPAKDLAGQATGIRRDVRLRPAAGARGG